MKQLIIAAACMFTLLTGYAQDSTKNKFSFAIRTGIGVWLEDPLLTLVQVGVQGEYRFSKTLSVVMPIQYNQLLELYGPNTEPGYLGIMAGPRVYVGEKFFGGIAAGYAFFLGDGSANTGEFVYHPHVGVDFRKTQLILGYTNFANSGGSPGFLDLTVAFKIGGKKR